MNACPGASYGKLEHVGGEDEAGRGLLADRDPDRPVDQVGQLLRHRAHLHVVAADVLEQAEQIDLLLVRAAHRRALGLADDGDHRHVVELGVVQPVEQVHRARARWSPRRPRPGRRTSRTRPPRTRPSPRAGPARTAACSSARPQAASSPLMPSPGKPKTCSTSHSRSRASRTSATVSDTIPHSFTTCLKCDRPDSWAADAGAVPVRRWPRVVDRPAAVAGPAARDGRDAVGDSAAGRRRC